MHTMYSSMCFIMYDQCYKCALHTYISCINNNDEFLRNCEQNQPLYEAVNGDELEIAILGQMITLNQLQNDPIAVSCVHPYTTLHHLSLYIGCSLA